MNHQLHWIQSKVSSQDHMIDGYTTLWLELDWLRKITARSFCWVEAAPRGIFVHSLWPVSLNTCSERNIVWIRQHNIRFMIQQCNSLVWKSNRSRKYWDIVCLHALHESRTYTVWYRPLTSLVLVSLFLKVHSKCIHGKSVALAISIFWPEDLDIAFNIVAQARATFKFRQASCLVNNPYIYSGAQLTCLSARLLRSDSSSNTSAQPARISLWSITWQENNCNTWTGVRKKKKRPKCNNFFGAQNGTLRWRCKCTAIKTSCRAHQDTDDLMNTSTLTQSFLTIHVWRLGSKLGIFKSGQSMGSACPFHVSASSSKKWIAIGALSWCYKDIQCIHLLWQ